MTHAHLIAQELSLSPSKIEAVIGLLNTGATVPFIARYRKEVSGNLDEVQIRTIEERRSYLAELDNRRQSILDSIDSQGKLSDALKAKILACQNKSALEDLYQPYKQKRRTRAMIAREKGLEPLAFRILEQPLRIDIEKEAMAFVDAQKGVEDTLSALVGARDIIAEMISDHADVRTFSRIALFEKGFICSKVYAEKEAEAFKFESYFDFKEAIKSIPSHRYLAIRRGEQEGFLRVQLDADSSPIIAYILKTLGFNPASPFSKELEHATQDAYKRLLFPSIETDIRVDLKLRADKDAVTVFATNLRNLLLAAPLGRQSVVGIDPGLRTGCKSVAVDNTGKMLGHFTFYLCKGDSALQKAKTELFAFIKHFSPKCIAIGNGTASRETETFVRTALKEENIKDIIVVQVSEAGASVYSASEIAREEFPDLDLTIRGAISIARRLQDPLAELVKIDPKAIGVGQYQHDVFQPLLQRKLDEVVESCVNHVGVELNTASAALLSRVAGIGPSLAKRIVDHRDTKGAFASRQDLLKVSGLGPRAFEQASGFLRIRDAQNPLDASAVHPERYSLVESIATDLGLSLKDLVGNQEVTRKIDVKRYTQEGALDITLRDIIDELQKPGRDPRQHFEAPQFREDVSSIGDLKPGMTLEGIVTNVAAFGAFVDIGVHQDGLVHISQLANHFVRDASEIVKVGDKLKVKVLEVDALKKRISLTAKNDAAPFKSPPPQKNQSPKSQFSNNPFANLKS